MNAAAGPTDDHAVNDSEARPMSNITSVSGPALKARIKDLSGETLVELLARAVARTPDSEAMVIRRGMADERWSYRQLSEVADRVAATLHRAGVRPGDRVLTWSQNDPWLVAAYFAVWRLGAVIVPLDLRMQTDVAVRIGKRARPAILLAGHDVDHDVAAELGVPILSVDQEGLDPPATRAETRPPLPDVDRDDLAEVIFTSGTTSDPKGVMLTHGQIVHTARVFAQSQMGPRPDRTLGIAPLSHMYGQTLPLLMGLMSGSTLVFLHALTPKAMIATMQREHITAVPLVPHVIRILLQGIEAEARRSGREESLRRLRRVARRLPFPLRRLLFRPVLAPLGGASGRHRQRRGHVERGAAASLGDLRRAHRAGLRHDRVRRGLWPHASTTADGHGGASVRGPGGAHRRRTASCSCAAPTS